MNTLLTPELLAHVGREGPPRSEVVTRRDIRKYAVATRQQQRNYLDGDEAPPLFHVALFWEVPELSELTPDGIFTDTLIPPLPLQRAMAGGLKIEYFRPIRPGDVLLARRRLSRLFEKEGRTGSLIFYEVTMQVTTEAGEPVLTETATRIMR